MAEQEVSNKQLNEYEYYDNIHRLIRRKGKSKNSAGAVCGKIEKQSSK